MTNQTVPTTSLSGIISAIDQAQSKLSLLEAANLEKSAAGSKQLCGFTQSYGTLNDVINGLSIVADILGGITGAVLPFTGFGMAGYRLFKGDSASEKLSTGIKSLTGVMQALYLFVVPMDAVVKLAVTVPQADQQMGEAAQKGMEEITSGYRAAGMDAQKVMTSEGQVVGAVLHYIGNADTV